MSIRRNLFACGLLTLGLLFTAPMTSNAAGQDTGSDQPRLLNLTFEGGTVGGYIDAVRSSVNNVNIILDLNDLELPMPQVELKAVELESAMELLDNRVVLTRDRQVILDVKQIRSSERDNPIFVVTSDSRPTGRGSDSSSAILSVQDVLKAGLTADDLLTAVQTALELFESDDAPAQIRFHEQTGLLIARGSAPQMATIRQVMDQLRETAHVHRQSAELERDRVHMQMERKQLQEKLTNSHHELEQATAELVKAHTRLEVLEQELHHMRVARKEQEVRAMDLAERLERMKQEVVHLQNQLQQANRNP